MNVDGIPLHPLVVHAVVVLTPLAAVLALVVALVPRWRWATRWPFVVVAVLGALATYFAALSGSDLKDRLSLRTPMMETHQSWAARLQVVMWVLAGAAIVGAVVLPYLSPIAGRGERAARIGVLRIPVLAVLVVAGVFALYAVYRTGEAGARLVWAGTPQ